MAFDSWRRRGVPQFRLTHVVLPRLREILQYELPEAIDALLDAGGLRANRMRRHAGRDDRRVPARRRALRAGDRPAPDGRGHPRPAARAGAGRRRAARRRRHRAAGRGGAAGRRPARRRRRPRLGRARRRRPRRRHDRPPLDPAGDAGRHRHRAARRGGRAPRLHLLLPLVPRRRTASCRRCSGRRCSTTTRCRSSPRRPTTGRGPSAWRPAPPTTGCAAPPTPRSGPASCGPTRCSPTGSTPKPITDVETMSATPDRRTRLVVDRRPIVTGVIALGDALACTSPMYGRGMTFGAMQAVCLRDVLREVCANDPAELAHRWHDRVANVVMPLVDETLAVTRHRLAEMDARVAGDHVRDRRCRVDVLPAPVRRRTARSRGAAGRDGRRRRVPSDLRRRPAAATSPRASTPSATCRWPPDRPATSSRRSSTGRRPRSPSDVPTRDATVPRPRGPGHVPGTRVRGVRRSWSGAAAGPACARRCRPGAGPRRSS